MILNDQNDPIIGVKSLPVINGNLLDATEQYIVHQTNTVSRGASGLAKAIFDRFPYANIYDGSVERIPGDVIIRGNGQDQRYVIGLNGQCQPGGLGVESSLDSRSKRIKYFQSGLHKIEQISNLESIAFPWNIGCGLAGGNWTVYWHMICAWANSLTNIKVRFYKL